MNLTGSRRELDRLLSVAMVASGFLLAVVPVASTQTAPTVSGHGEKASHFGIPGTDAGILREFGKTKCYEYPGYLILVRPADGLGEDILVKQRDTARECKPDLIAEKGDFEIKNELSEYFNGVRGKLLFIDSSSGPPPDLLIIYDLSSWAEDGPGTKENCSEFAELTSGGLEEVIERKVALDLETLESSKSAQIRCSSRE